MRIVRQAIRGLGLEAHLGHRLVDIRLPSVNKGIAVKRWLRLMEPVGLSRSAVCYAGDDTTDEYAFRMLPAPIVTIAVGRRTDGARLRTSGPAAFARWLARLAKARRRSTMIELRTEN
jgi:trehalose-phosphatase